MKPSKQSAGNHILSRGFALQFVKALPGVVGVLSLLALLEGIGTKQLAFINYPRLTVSLLGLMGTGSYFLRSHRCQSVKLPLTLLWLWAFVQLLVIQVAISNGSFWSTEEPVWENRFQLWNTSQFLSLPITGLFVFETGAGHLICFSPNFLPLLFLACINKLRRVKQADLQLTC